MNYYYTNQIAAAWMAEAFDMKIALRDDYAPDKLVIGEDGQVVNYAQEVLDCKRDGWCDKFYVHPDSLYLLEPTVDDAIQIGDDLLFWVCDDDSFWEDHKDDPHLKYNFIGIKSAACHVEDGARIIQRNGVVFHWPESEAA